MRNWKSHSSGEKVGPGWFGVGFDDNCRDLGKNDALVCDNANDGYMNTYKAQ